MMLYAVAVLNTFRFPGKTIINLAITYFTCGFDLNYMSTCLLIKLNILMVEQNKRLW